MSDPPPLRSFGRLRARPLKTKQIQTLEAVSAMAAPPASGPLDGSWAAGARGFGLEIGFGAGEHLAGQAKLLPDWAFLGCEPFVNGFAQGLAALQAADAIGRVRAHNGDVRALTSRVPDAHVDRVWLLFPDPWPKARHWKRRLVQPEFARELARMVKPGGDIRFATDWRHYAAWSLEVFLKTPGLEWLADSAADWRTPFAGHVTTRYQTKALGDSAPIYLRFGKR